MSFKKNKKSKQKKNVGKPILFSRKIGTTERVMIAEGTLISLNRNPNNKNVSQLQIITSSSSCPTSTLLLRFYHFWMKLLPSRGTETNANYSRKYEHAVQENLILTKYLVYKHLRELRILDFRINTLNFALNSSIDSSAQT